MAARYTSMTTQYSNSQHDIRTFLELCASFKCLLHEVQAIKPRRWQVASNSGQQKHRLAQTFVFMWPDASTFWLIKVKVFWTITPCLFIICYRRFFDYPEDGGSILARNVDYKCSNNTRHIPEDCNLHSYLFINNTFNDLRPTVPARINLRYLILGRMINNELRLACNEGNFSSGLLNTKTHRTTSAHVVLREYETWSVT